MPKVIKRKPTPDARIEAMLLLGRWTSLAQGHVVMGAGCSCGVAGGSLRVAEFEQQILDYLDTRHAACEPRKAGSLDVLLRSIAAGPASGGESLALLADLKRTLDSFDELHGAR